MRGDRVTICITLENATLNGKLISRPIQGRHKFSKLQVCSIDITSDLNRDFNAIEDVTDVFVGNQTKSIANVQERTYRERP